MRTFQLPLFAVCLAALLSTNSAHAQENNVLVASNPAHMSAKPSVKNSLSEVMGLTYQETKDFLPVHQQYKSDLVKLKKESLTLLKDGDSSNDQLTDDQSWIGLDELIRYQKKKANLQKKYARRVRLVLPPKKATKYFLLESQQTIFATYEDK